MSFILISYDRLNDYNVVLHWQVACVTLINTIVTIPDDLDFRLHLRNEFMRDGLREILEVRYPI